MRVHSSFRRAGSKVKKLNYANNASYGWCSKGFYVYLRYFGYCAAKFNTMEAM